MKKFAVWIVLVVAAFSAAPAAHAAKEPHVRSATALLSSELLSSRQSIEVDSPYWNKHYRDSVNYYQGRLAAYHQEILSYDLAFAFSFLPFAAEFFLTKHTAKAGLYFFARTAAVAAMAIGTVGLIRAQGSEVVNVVYVAAGVAAYVFFKIAEMTEVQHDVSHFNESLVSEYRIATPDIDSGSIRYPVHQWPAWITTAPPARQPRSAHEVIRQNMTDDDRATGGTAPSHIQLGVQIPF